jgi:Holliday junction DNA helicase RuvA
MLMGNVAAHHETGLIVDVHGVGYDVLTHRRFRTSVSLNQAVRLFIITHVREDHIHLYGFNSATEKQWFETLTTVQGVGAKMALSLLDTMAPAQLAMAIGAGDTRALTAADGVGPKLAARLVTELRDKVLKLPTEDHSNGASMATGAGSTTKDPAPAETAPNHKSETKKKAPTAKSGGTTAAATADPSHAQRDAVSALVNLGYAPAEAFAAVAAALLRAHDAPTAHTTGALIAAALRTLGRG